MSARATGWATVIGLLALLAAPALAALPPPCPDVRGPIVPPLLVLPDATGALTFAQARALDPQSFPLRFAEPFFNAGYSGATVWSRFRVVNPWPRPVDLVLELARTIDRADLYLEGRGAGPSGRAGRKVPFSARPIDHRSVAFRLRLAPCEATVAHLRIAGEDVLLLAPKIREEPAFWRRAARENLLLGIYLGVLVAMVIYNLTVYLAIFDRTYLLYVLFQASFLMMVGAFDHVWFQYLWPESPGWANRSECFFSGLALAAGIAFAAEFLELRRYAPGFCRPFVGAGALAALLALAGAASSNRWVLLVGNLIVILVCFLVLAGAHRCRQRGSENAAIFLVAWVTLIVAVLLTAVGNLGLLQTDVPFEEALKLGSATEAMLLALGLANRIKRIRLEKQRAQATLLESQAAQARELERQVEQRTRDLHQALTDLRATQSRLVRQARMATLGNVAAGLAHEVGNPLNFSSGGVADLERRLGVVRTAIAAVQADPVATAGRLEAAANALGASDQALRLIRSGHDRIQLLIDTLRRQLCSSPIDLHPTDLLTELEATLALLRKRLDDQDIRIVRDCEPLPMIPCRRGELGQVFLNLLLNSCQAIGSAGEIRISSRHTADSVELRFADSGPGIRPEHREAIFDPFFTTRPPNEGVGLGLAISQEIVRRHGGDLLLLDQVGGATFLVRLPIPRPAEEERPGRLASGK